MIYFAFLCAETTVLIYLILILQLTAVDVYVIILTYNINAHQFSAKSFKTWSKIYLSQINILHKYKTFNSNSNKLRLFLHEPPPSKHSGQS